MESHSKVCTKCKEEKPLVAFGNSRASKDGLQYQCKACKNQYSKQYYQENREYYKQYYQENREKKLKYFRENREIRSEYNKQYYQNNREKRLEYRKQYYQKNRDKYSEYNKQYRQDNLDKMKEYEKQYYQENREHYSEYKKKNREKYTANEMKRNALKRDSIPEALLNCPIEKDRLEKTYKLRSLLSKATGVEYHVDHIWPLSKGGPHWSGNLQVITAEENLSKSDSFCEDTARVIQESLDEHLSNRQ